MIITNTEKSNFTTTTPPSTTTRLDTVASVAPTPATLVGTPPRNSSLPPYSSLNTTTPAPIASTSNTRGRLIIANPSSSNLSNLLEDDTDDNKPITTSSPTAETSTPANALVTTQPSQLVDMTALMQGLQQLTAQVNNLTKSVQTLQHQNIANI